MNSYGAFFHTIRTTGHVSQQSDEEIDKLSELPAPARDKIQEPGHPDATSSARSSVGSWRAQNPQQLWTRTFSSPAELGIISDKNESGEHPNEILHSLDRKSRIYPQSVPTMTIITDRVARRRQQNRNSQRAYRERRLQHASDLETKIEELEKWRSSLQDENRTLLQELWELRMANVQLAGSSTDAIGTRASPVPSPARVVSPLGLPFSKEQLSSFYGPYLAVWNLMFSELPPGSPREALEPVLGHLQAMAVCGIQIVIENDTPRKE